jgi:hypothetical protein
MIKKTGKTGQLRRPPGRYHIQNTIFLSLQTDNDIRIHPLHLAKLERLNRIQ